MPEISRFFGLIITMYYNDHSPPHFHVRYGDHKAVVAIDGPRLLEGKLGPRAVGLIMEWAALHHEELLADWELARQMQPLNPVPPLE